MAEATCTTPPKCDGCRMCPRCQEDLHVGCEEAEAVHSFHGLSGGLCDVDLWPNGTRPHRCGRLANHKVHDVGRTAARYP